MKNDNNSLRNFPADLIAASGIPMVIVALVTSWLCSLHGWPWVAAYCSSLLLAIVGAIYLFCAKLPLYRQQRFFTFGSQHLPPASLPLYRLGCRLSIAGISFALILLMASFFWRNF